ncbi:MAG: pectin esterase [Caulobacterales bacterium]|nr:pectin esterase [Caulobacterales bacterium]
MVRRARRPPPPSLAAARLFFAAGLSLAAAARAEAVVVSPTPGALQAAIDALPASGGVIALRPGVYREKLTIAKPHVRLLGLGASPAAVTIVWGDAARTAGGTGKSASVTITGDDVRLRNLTIQNDYWLQAPDQPSQAVALAVTGDREVFDRVRLLGHQDTLYAASRVKCDGRGCGTSRQLFRDCYVEGHVDFIFGDAKALFQRCEIHALSHGEVMLTAQSKATPGQDSGYVFDHCRVTAEPGAAHIWLGRPWRPYASVVVLETRLDAPVEPAGWREWHAGETHSLETAFYAERGSSGPGADPAHRDPHSHQLSAAEAKAWSFHAFLSGPDHWRP